MPMILIETSVAAGAVNTNLVSGSAFEFARQRQLMSCGVVQSATGGFATITSGPDIIAEEFSAPILTTYPIIPDNMYFTDVMEQGDRLGRVGECKPRPQRSCQPDSNSNLRFGLFFPMQ